MPRSSSFHIAKACAIGGIIAVALAGNAHGVAALEAKSADLVCRRMWRGKRSSLLRTYRVLGAEQQFVAAKRDAARE